LFNCSEVVRGLGDVSAPEGRDMAPFGGVLLAVPGGRAVGAGGARSAKEPAGAAERRRRRVFYGASS